MSSGSRRLHSVKRPRPSKRRLTQTRYNCTIAPYYLHNFAFSINSSLLLMIKRLLLVSFLSMFALSSRAAAPASGEYIILVGGRSMYRWAKYKTYPHAHCWAKFVRAARLRTAQLRAALGPDAKITGR